MPFSYEKLIVSGRLIELYQYEKSIAYDYVGLPTKRGKRERAKEAQDTDPRCLSSAYRAKARLKRLGFANAWEWKRPDGERATPIFITLTFKDNIVDPKIAHGEFTKAMERLNYHWDGYLPDGLKYVAVPERQKSGRLHYHLLAFNLPFIPLIYDSLNRIWGNGFHKVDPVKTSPALFAYMGKYLTKDMATGREFNGKRYFSSRGLHQPFFMRNEGHVSMILKSVPADTKVWQIEIDPKGKAAKKRTGKILYRRYLLKEQLSWVGVADSFGATLGVAHEQDVAETPARPLSFDN